MGAAAIHSGRRGALLRRLSVLVQRLGANVVGWALALFVLVPFAWVIFGALKSRAEIGQDPLGLPAQWQWQNIVQAWQVGHFSRYFMNSVYVVAPTVALILVLSTLAAYAFSFMEFPGKAFLSVIFLFGLAIPLDILIIPLFYDLLALRLLNTHWAIILPQVSICLPFGILLLRSFMADLPHEILDAACIDGCSALELLYHIVVPLSRPVLTSLLVFTFMWTWNQFLLPVVVIQIDTMRTLPIGLNYFQGRYITNLPLLMAGATISFLPVVAVYMVFQRQFITGIVAGAFK